VVQEGNVRTTVSVIRTTSSVVVCYPYSTTDVNYRLSDRVKPGFHYPS